MRESQNSYNVWAEELGLKPAGERWQSQKCADVLANHYEVEAGCPAIPPEYMVNSEFNCGLNGWTTDALYPGDLVDNGDGTLTLTAQNQYATMIPTTFPTENKSWKFQIDITSYTGNIEMKLKRNGGNWENHPITSTGITTWEFNGAIDYIGVGAQTDINAVLTINRFNLREVI